MVEIIGKVEKWFRILKKKNKYKFVTKKYNSKWKKRRKEIIKRKIWKRDIYQRKKNKIIRRIKIRTIK